MIIAPQIMEEVIMTTSWASQHIQLRIRILVGPSTESFTFERNMDADEDFVNFYPLEEDSDHVEELVLSRNVSKTNMVSPLPRKVPSDDRNDNPGYFGTSQPFDLAVLALNIGDWDGSKGLEPASVHECLKTLRFRLGDNLRAPTWSHARPHLPQQQTRTFISSQPVTQSHYTSAIQGILSLGQSLSMPPKKANTLQASTEDDVEETGEASGRGETGRELVPSIGKAGPGISDSSPSVSGLSATTVNDLTNLFGGMIRKQMDELRHEFFSSSNIPSVALPDEHTHPAPTDNSYAALAHPPGPPPHRQGNTHDGVIGSVAMANWTAAGEDHRCSHDGCTHYHD